MAETTHVVYQGKHYELPGQLSREDAEIRVRNLTNQDLPRMAPGFGNSRDLNPEEQASLDESNAERSEQFRGEGWSEGYPDAQDWGKLAGGAAFAAAPSVGGALAPYLHRGMGAVTGAEEGYKKGGLEGAVVGGGIGAAYPPLAGAAAGYDAYGPAGMVGGGLLYGGGGTLMNLGKKALGGAAAGAIAGNVPFIGKGTVEGAKLGAMTGMGQKGMGALWKHGKQMEIIKRLMKVFGVSADEAAQIASSGAAEATVPAGMSSTGGLRAAEVGRAVSGGLTPEKEAILAADRARRAAAAERALAQARGAAGGLDEAGGVSTTMGPTSAPAPPGAAPAAAPVSPGAWPPQSAMTLEGASQRGGRKALDAALEAGGAMPQRSTWGSPIGSYDPALQAGGGAAASAAPETGEIVLKLQQMMSMPGGRQAVMEWLQQQPPEVAQQILPLLKQGASKMGTVFGEL